MSDEKNNRWIDEPEPYDNGKDVETMQRYYKKWKAEFEQEKKNEQNKPQTRDRDERH